MKKYTLVILGIIVNSSVMADPPYLNYRPYYTPCPYNTCIKQCPPKYVRKSYSYYKTYWYTYSNQLIRAYETIEPAEYLDLH